jgi:amino acid permease
MSVTGCSIAWVGICSSYLRFRKIIHAQALNDNLVSASVSPLQPYLAWYGLFWSLLMGNPSLYKLIPVFLQGYLAFTRGNTYWNIVSSNWGYSLAPYSLVAGSIILFMGWAIKSYIFQGQLPWQVARVYRVDLFTGVAPSDSFGMENPSKLGWRRVVTSVLNAL